jgi:hypothetical protein
MAVAVITADRARPDWQLSCVCTVHVSGRTQICHFASLTGRIVILQIHRPMREGRGQRAPWGTSGCRIVACITTTSRQLQWGWTSRRTDTTSRRTDTTSRRTDTTSRRTDTTSRRIDTTSRCTDTTSVAKWQYKAYGRTTEQYILMLLTPWVLLHSHL